VRLTAYSGGAADLPPAALQEFIDAVSEDAAVVPTGGVYYIDQIVEAHTAMEEGRVAGKIVVLT
jgi:NADPH:quinone reductase